MIPRTTLLEENKRLKHQIAKMQKQSKHQFDLQVAAIKREAAKQVKADLAQSLKELKKARAFTAQTVYLCKRDKEKRDLRQMAEFNSNLKNEYYASFCSYMIFKEWGKYNIEAAWFRIILILAYHDLMFLKELHGWFPTTRSYTTTMVSRMTKSGLTVKTRMNIRGRTGLVVTLTQQAKDLLADYCIYYDKRIIDMRVSRFGKRVKFEPSTYYSLRLKEAIVKRKW